MQITARRVAVLKPKFVSGALNRDTAVELGKILQGRGHAANALRSALSKDSFPCELLFAGGLGVLPGHLRPEARIYAADSVLRVPFQSLSSGWLRFPSTKDKLCSNGLKRHEHMSWPRLRIEGELRYAAVHGAIRL